MHRTFQNAIVAFGFILLLTFSVRSEEPWKVSESVFDFGAVGIDYTIFHDFKLINTGQKVFKIDSVDVRCDCSSVRYAKSVLNPGDTVDLQLSFETKDFFGPVNRQFNVFVSTPDRSVIRFFYLAEVGQWQNGLKPDPFSVFILPTHKQQTVKINNRFFESMRAEIESIHSNNFKVEITKGEAATNEQIVLTVIPDQHLAKGTYLSNFTVKIITEDEGNPAYLTLPVKIVRF